MIKKIENLENSFLELILTDTETAIEVLKENNIDIDRLKRKLLRKIKNISNE